MRYFARIVFYVKDSIEFRNLSAIPSLLFQQGNAACSVSLDQSVTPSKMVFSYGPFETQDQAETAGKELFRIVRLSMIEKRIPVGPYREMGLLDRPKIVVSHSTLKQWDQLVDGLPEKYREAARTMRIENEITGIGIFEVEDNLDEIQFAQCSMSRKRVMNLSVDYLSMPSWTASMDTALAYLNASEETIDVRIIFLLRSMALEALVAEERDKDTPYLKALNQLKKSVLKMDTGKEMKDRLISMLGEAKKKSVRSKIMDLLTKYLPEKKYENQSVIKFFDECYSARSQLVHSGQSSERLGSMCEGLRRMILDLLYAMGNVKDS